MTHENPRAVIGNNGGPAIGQRNFKKRWADAIFAHPDPRKPTGAVAMAFKICMTMDNNGEGAAISNWEFMQSCRVSDSSIREFKKWLVREGFIVIMARGYRGSTSLFRATIPNEIAAPVAPIHDEIPATNSAIANLECPQPSAPITNEMAPMAAAIAEISAPVAGIPATLVPARLESPSGININNNNQLAGAPERDFDQHEEIGGLNGSTAAMLGDIKGWMPGGDDQLAREWLSKFVHIHGQDITKNSYLKLVTDLASGNIIARPMQAWTSIAQRMKDAPRNKSQQVPPSETVEGVVQRMKGKAAELAEKHAKGVRK